MLSNAASATTLAGTPSGHQTLRVVVIGGTGLIGSKLVSKLRDHGHEAIAASPDSGVNTLTGEGLPEALHGASVVVDVSNSPSFEDKAVMDFFTTSTRNLLAAGADAGVKHHVALSVVGTERLQESGYFRAKRAQEELIRGSSLPYTIVHATQFFEFTMKIADAATKGKQVRLAPVYFQPMAADDVASALERAATGLPLNHTLEVAGPDAFRLDEFVRQALSSRQEPREVITDPESRYFGARLDERTLMPSAAAQAGATHLKHWLMSQESRK